MYEPRLIREQVAQLTGYRWFEGSSDDQAEDTALTNAGAIVAKEYRLTPGIALSAAQMAQLTSDIVWLVERKVLVPQVYVRVRPGDLDGSGALLSADASTLRNQAGQGDVVDGERPGRDLGREELRPQRPERGGGQHDRYRRHDGAQRGQRREPAASTVDSRTGLVSIHADRDIVITAGQSTSSVADARRTGTSGLLSTTTTTTRNTLDETLGHGSRLSGGLVAIAANGNITGEGVTLGCDDSVPVHAEKALNVYKARDSRSDGSSISISKSRLARIPAVREGGHGQGHLDASAARCPSTTPPSTHGFHEQRLPFYSATVTARRSVRGAPGNR